MEKLPVLDHVGDQVHKDWEPHLRIREAQRMVGSSHPMIAIELPYVLEVLQRDVR